VFNDNVVLFSSYAKLPSGTVSGEVFKVMAVVVLIDITTGKIIDADCTLSTRTAERFVKDILVGAGLANGPDKLIAAVNETYQGSAKKAIITAIKGVYDRYVTYMQNREKELNALSSEGK